MESPATAAFLGVVLPALVCAVTLAATLAVGRRAGLAPEARWCVALAVGAGYLVGHLAIHRPAWPPLDVEDRIPFFALAAFLLGLLDALWPGPAWTRWENWLLVSALVVVILLGPAVQETWDTRATVLWLTALGFGIAVSWANLDALASRITGSAIVLPLLVVVAGASVVLLVSGCMTLARFGGVLSAILGAVLIVSWWARSISLDRGGVTIVTVVLASLLLEGHVYSGLPASSLALLAASPWAIWVERIGPVRRLAPWKSTILAVVAVLVPVGVALGLALAASPPLSSSPSPSEY